MLKRIFWTGLFLNLLGANLGFAQKTSGLKAGLQTPANPAGELFQREWTGRILLSASLPGEPVQEPTPLVIRDQAAYTAFLERLPRYKIQKKAPAPPSDDPLLKRPHIDFSKQMLLVLIRADSMYVAPRLKEPAVDMDSRLVVLKHLPPLGDTQMHAARGDVGMYHAVLIKRFDKLRFIKERKPTP